ncbi:MAG: pseudouridine synthase [Syntrophales bacterium]|nr:pseudouridine synthase [Syntrophales bacterium]MDD5232126.1 pseudouridine synthase [Syntrophales bacterium]MDD5531997.1 pseudouridine synthase [Syntrophales bacterium]HPL62912.1 pseudouridine synthase [Syntrophales bacterium]
MERLQKIIANAGIASRRAAEQLIREGRVSVNGVVVTGLGSKASLDDEIRVDGKLISTESYKVYLMLNKPAGYVTTLRDPEGRKIVMDLIGDMHERIYPVGRLDYDSEGLLILTNDGEFAQKLQHPSYMVPKIYAVKIKGNLTRKGIAEICAGVKLEDGLFAPQELRIDKVNPKSTWLRVAIQEGRNRVLRRLFDKLGHPVQRLIRIGVGDLALGSLKPGDSRHLKDAEVRKLKSFFRKQKN